MSCTPSPGYCHGNAPCFCLFITGWSYRVTCCDVLPFHSQLHRLASVQASEPRFFFFTPLLLPVCIVHPSLTYPLLHSRADGMTSTASPIPTSVSLLSLWPAHHSLYSAELLTFCARFLQTTPSKCKLFLYISLKKKSFSTNVSNFFTSSHSVHPKACLKGKFMLIY